MSFGSEFILTLFTNDPAIARRADEAGVNRIGPDLETVGKQARQGHLKSNPWISDHQESQLPAVGEALHNAQLFVRTNPIHDGSEEEIERLIGMGAQVLMLPYFRTVEEPARFAEIIAGRALVTLLLETVEAAERIDEIARLDGIDEIQVGLNDLHLSLGLGSHFEVITTDFMSTLSEAVRLAGIPFGFGGIGRVGDESLPISSDLVYAQYPRLKATRAMVSRVFLGPDPERIDMAYETDRFRSRMDYWHARSAEELDAAREKLRQEVRSFLAQS